MNFKKIAMDSPLNIAFLGCGGVTEKHSKTLKAFKNVNRFYASRSAEKATKSCAKWKGAGHFGSYDSAITSDKIDVILVATPPDTHLDLTIKAVKSGKHVIVEKPPFFKSTDFDQVKIEMEKTGVQVMVAENYFYKPVLIRLRELLATDLIGDVKFMYFNSTKTQTQEDWRNESKVAGGGALFEGGIHWINFISNLGMPIKKITGFQPQKPDSQLERSMQVVAEYESGAIGTMLYSWEINALINGLRISRIYGTKGSITFESNGVFIFVRGKKWKFILPGFADIGGSKAMFLDFFDAIRNGRPPQFDFELAKRDLMFVEEAYRTAEN